MKKMRVLLLAALILILVGCGQKDDVQWYVSERFIEFETGDVNHITYTYDDQWQMLESHTLLNGDFASSVTYTYSEDGTVVTMTTESAIYEPDVTEVHRTFDEAGNIIRNSTYYNGELNSTAEITYDEEGREILVVGTAAQNGMVTRVTHTYDDNGNVLTYGIHNGFYESRHVYTYDSQGRRASETFFHDDVMTGSVGYANTGKIQKGTYCDAQGKPLREVINTYDDDGNLLVEESYDLAGNLQSRTTHVYISTDGRTSGEIPQ